MTTSQSTCESGGAGQGVTLQQGDFHIQISLYKQCHSCCDMKARVCFFDSHQNWVSEMEWTEETNPGTEQICNKLGV